MLRLDLHHRAALQWGMTGGAAIFENGRSTGTFGLHPQRRPELLEPRELSAEACPNGALPGSEKMLGPQAPRATLHHLLRQRHQDPTYVVKKVAQANKHNE